MRSSTYARRASSDTDVGLGAAIQGSGPVGGDGFWPAAVVPREDGTAKWKILRVSRLTSQDLNLQIRRKNTEFLARLGMIFWEFRRPRKVAKTAKRQ